MTSKTVCTPNEPYTLSLHHWVKNRWSLFILHSWLAPSGSKDIYPLCKYIVLQIRSKLISKTKLSLNFINIVVKWRHSDVSRLTCRNNLSEMFFKIDVLKTFANFTEKHLCWSIFLQNTWGGCSWPWRFKDSIMSNLKYKPCSLFHLNIKW